MAKRLQYRHRKVGGRAKQVNPRSLRRHTRDVCQRHVSWSTCRRCQRLTFCVPVFVEERPLSSFYEPDSSTSSFLIFVHPPSKPMATLCQTFPPPTRTDSSIAVGENSVSSTSGESFRQETSRKCRKSKSNERRRSTACIFSFKMLQSALQSMPHWERYIYLDTHGLF